MVTSIVSNSSNSLAAYSLTRNLQSQAKSVGRISSGSVTANTADNSVADSVSLRLKNSAATDVKVVSNITNALSYLEAQSKSLTHIGDLVSSMMDVVSQMADPAKSASDLANYMQEFNALRQSLTAERSTTFSGQSLHDKTGQATAFEIRLNSDGTQSTTFTESNFATNGGGAWDTLIGVATQDLQTTDESTTATDGTVYGDSTQVVATQASSGSNSAAASGAYTGAEGSGTSGVTDSAENLLNNDLWGQSSFDILLQGVSSMLANNAAQQAQLRFSLDSASTRGIHLANAESKISDPDVAHEVSNLARTQILTQSASSAMAQTNVTAEGVIKALWGEPSSGIEWYKPGA